MYAVYDMPRTYHHTPLIIYSPGIINKPQVFSCVGGQIDIFPTIMGILNIPYVNNTFGIDLRKEQRPFIILTSDTVDALLDDEYYLIVKERG